MFEQFGDVIGSLLGTKKTESLEEHIMRLKELVDIEERTTKALEVKLQQQREINELQGKVLKERGAQTTIYRNLGTPTPQVQKQKQLRMWIFGIIGVIVIFLVAKSCF